MRAKQYNKAIMAILGGLVTLGAVLGFGDIPGGQETVASLGGILTTLLVVFGPKNEGG